MTPTSPDAAPSTDRQPRVRRLTGLIAGGVAIAAATIAIPALAATTDPQVAASSETTVTSAALAASVAVTAPSTTSTSTTTTAPAPPAPTAEELLAAQLDSFSPEQKLAFDLYVASPEERAAWAAFIAPPPPPPPPAPAPVAPPAATGGGAPPNAFLACVRQRESGGNYSISSGDGLYRGAYQFHQNTWNNTANHAGRGDLVGRDPASVAPADQDAMAAALYSWQGSAPWGGAC